MFDYISEDIINSRVRFGDKTIWAMVVCDSSEQAREIFRIFNEKKDEHHLTGALILHDEWDKDTRKDWIKDFKEGKIDVLFVYAMLLTGFDAPRLKKMYLWRKVKAHNLLQTLTRVNRPYQGFHFGYVVDFANISEEFEATNKAYLDELTREYECSCAIPRSRIRPEQRSPRPHRTFSRARLQVRSESGSASWRRTSHSGYPPS